MSRLNGALSLTLALALAACGCSHAPAPTTAAPAPAARPDPLTEALRTRLNWTGTPFRVKIAGERIHAEQRVPRFYKARGYQPAWLSSDAPDGPSPVPPRVAALTRAVAEAANDGLKPGEFHQTALSTLLEDLARRRSLGMPTSLERLADLELLLTDAYLTLANQLQSGKVRPKMPGYEWYIPETDRRELTEALESALAADTLARSALPAVPTSATGATTDAISASLKDLQSHQTQYWKLREALAEYRRIAADGGWKIVTPGPSIHRGDRDKRVPLLRSRLLASHDLATGAAPDPRVFDEPLEAALKHFQLRHGLTGDGALGKGTIDALNVSPLKRVRQLEINLERWRWLPADLGPRYLAVNIAGFSLRVVENDRIVLRMPVVVGNQYRHTPVFSGVLSHVTLNPSWFVPAKIAIEDLLPKVRKNPDYLDEHGFTVLERTRARKLVEVDSSQIDWSKLDDTNFGYVLRQDPGDTNSLGRVKFTFPNRFNVYLHDSPAKDLFRKRVRSFSSGCIRLSHPLDLLKYVLGADPEWPPDGEEKSLALPEPLRINILYETAWVDDDGAVNFRPDVYSQDELLDQYL